MHSSNAAMLCGIWPSARCAWPNRSRAWALRSSGSYCKILVQRLDRAREAVAVEEVLRGAPQVRRVKLRGESQLGQLLERDAGRAQVLQSGGAIWRCDASLVGVWLTSKLPHCSSVLPRSSSCSAASKQRREIARAARALRRSAGDAGSRSSAAIDPLANALDGQHVAAINGDRGEALRARGDSASSAASKSPFCRSTSASTRLAARPSYESPKSWRVRANCLRAFVRVAL